MLTFRDLQLLVLRYIDEPEDTDTTLALVKDALNRSHRALAGERTWPWMQWPREETLTTTAGTRVYALKPGVGKLLTVYDRDYRQTFPLVSRRDWEALGVNRVDQREIPAGLIYGDWWPVAAQPGGATVSAVSSSASDSGGPTLVIKGITSTGEATTETLTMTGTTTVAGSVTWEHIWGVTKTGTWAGTLTLTSGGSTILSLTSSEEGKQYPTVEFIETPQSARSYLYTAQRTPLKLVNDGDIPDTPYPWSEIHAYDALLDLTAYNSELSTKHQNLWSSRRDSLYNNLLDAMDERIAGSRPRYVRPIGPTRRPFPFTTS